VDVPPWSWVVARTVPGAGKWTLETCMVPGGVPTLHQG
jgi:hypothetical protein